MKRIVISLALAISAAGCAYRSAESAGGITYRSLHILMRETIAEAEYGEFRLEGYTRSPDADTAKAIADSATNLP